MSRTPSPPILIAGPTASGKSALALQLAERHGGIVINADSMQVYAELRILTARPGPEDTRRVPHRLYGHVAASEPYSVARWLADVAAALAEAAAVGARPIIVGGTGLYFKALTEGLSPVPAISPEVRRRWRDAAAEAPPGALHAELAARDAIMAERLEPGDSQRIVRALEVLEETGRSLADWQAVPGRPLVDSADATRILINLPRAELHQRSDQRFDLMLSSGALDEVKALLALALPADAPAMRALGVAPLAAHLRGVLPREEAGARAKAETRQYIKRQQTWARRHMADWQPLNEAKL
jgi:tRNA dimethylallyltransferase